MPRRIESGFNKGYRAVRRAIRLLRGYPVVFDVNHSAGKVRRQRALLVYLTEPFLLKETDPIFYWHQNFRQSRQIAAVLDEYGYVVDVADIADKRFVPDRPYDLVVSHRVDLDPGHEFFKNAIRVYLATGMNHIVHNRCVRSRYQDVAQRRGCTLKVLEIHTEEMPFVSRAKAICTFGNSLIALTWKEKFAVPVFPFNNYAFTESFTWEIKRDFPKARNCFLFFATSSQVRKGLDLLLEIFPKHPQLQLFVCSKFADEPDFCRCYDRELFHTPNIHPLGIVHLHSPLFKELIETCAYVIAPSCTEGQSGAVVQCMAFGLIPIISRENGIDSEDFGVLMEDIGLAEIEKTVLKMAEMPETWLQEQSRRTREAASMKFSEAAFQERWREMLTKILTRGEVR